MNPRFNALGDENTVVYNSYQGDTWGEEFREGGFPFKQGKEFEVSAPVCWSVPVFVCTYSIRMGENVCMCVCHKQSSPCLCLSVSDLCWKMSVTAPLQT